MLGKGVHELECALPAGDRGALLFGFDGAPQAAGLLPPAAVSGALSEAREREDNGVRSCVR